MKKITLILSILISFITSHAQKRVVSYPFQYAKTGLGLSHYGSFYLQDNTTKQFLLVLTDHKKAEYILFDDKVKKVASFSPEGGLSNTVFHFDQEDYLGGTAGNGKFHFVYKVLDIKSFKKNSNYYQMETVDMVNKSVTNRQLFEIPNDEKLLLSFGNFGQYYSITANNKEGDLTFYGLNSAGESFQKTIHIEIPSTSKKKKLAEYLDNMQLITVDENEEAGLELAAEKVKLFHAPDKMTIVVNESDQPTQIITIHSKSFSVQQREIDHSALTKEEKGNSYVNSFLFENLVYSLVLNKKNIRIAIYDEASGKLIRTHEINEDSNLESFASAPVAEKRMGEKPKVKDIEHVKKLIRLLDKGSEGLSITRQKNGKLVMTIGTYDIIKVTGGGGGGRVSQGVAWTPTPGVPAGYGSGSWTPTTVYRPGYPAHTKYGANYYNSVAFKLLIDPESFNLAKGMAPASVNEKIKNYMVDLGEDVPAMNQFSINGKQYVSYYDKKAKYYLIEEISIK